jgi:hypothetical protein
MKGAIFSKIDTGSESIDQASLVSATKRFLNDTSRIKFIVYCWDMSPAQNSIALGYGAVGMGRYGDDLWFRGTTNCCTVYA